MAEENKPLDVEKLREIFNKHDFNNDGTICYDEIKPLLIDLGIPKEYIKPYDIDLNFLAQGDKDSDHKINFEEFVAVMNKIAEEKKKTDS